MHCIKDTGGIMEKFYCINMSNLTVSILRYQESCYDLYLLMIAFTGNYL